VFPKKGEHPSSPPAPAARPRPLQASSENTFSLWRSEKQMAVSPVLASGLWLRTATRCHSRRHEMQSLFCPLPSQQQHSCSSPPAFRSQTPLFTARDTGTQTVIPAALTVIVNKEHLLALFFWCVYFYLSVSSPTSSWPLSQLQRSLSKLLCFSQAVSHLHKTL